MSFYRGCLSQLIGCAFVISAVSPTLGAENEHRPSVRMVVPCPIGSPTDVAAREIAQWWSENSPKTYHVQNVPMLTASIGLSTLVASLVEGETMLFDLGDCNNVAGID
jgi:tripartite-type tricarboxylate transporter receptor subunit TctC